MNTHAEKTQENKSQAVANGFSQKQSSSESTFQFVDNRPEAIAQRKLQEMANNNPQLKQLKAIQEMANNSNALQRKVVQFNKKKIKCVTTGLFETSHLAKSEEDALTKGRERGVGQRYLHFMQRDYLQNVDSDFERQFADELKADIWNAPNAHVAPNNYWTTGKYHLWEYDKNKDKVSIQKYQLCLGLFFTPKPLINKIEIGIHHIQGVK